MGVKYTDILICLWGPIVMAFMIFTILIYNQPRTFEFIETPNNETQYYYNDKKEDYYTKKYKNTQHS